MGTIEFNHSPPGTGKTFKAKSEITKDYKRGKKYKTLFLVPLKSLRWREKSDLTRNFGLDPRDLHVLRGKNEVGCSLLRNSYSILASLILCSKCPSKNCWYRQLINYYMSSTEGIWIGDHRFLPFALFGKAKLVVIDEYDAMIPNYFFQPVSREELEALLKSGVISKQDIDDLYRKGMVFQHNGTLYVASTFFIINLAVYTSRIRMLSATPLPDPRLTAKLFLCDPEEQPISSRTIVHLENGDIVVKMKDPYVPSQVKIRAYFVQRKIFMSSPDRKRVVGEVIPKLVSRLSGKVTIIAGSKQEMHRIKYMLEKKLPHLKVVSEDVPDYSMLDQADVRVITVAGRLSRGWDIDSDAVIALWQYDRPDEALKKIELYDELFPQIGGRELYKYLQYRRHIQTLFRTIRRYDRPHTLILLDRSWFDAIAYFPTTRFLVEKGFVRQANPKELLKELLAVQ